MMRILRISFLAILSATILSACSGSKNLYKQGVKLEKAGLDQEAANFYIESLNRNRKNTDAIIALKKTGQRVLDDKLSEFYRFQADDQHKEAVYAYRSAESFKRSAENVGVKLEISNQYTEYYEETREIYLSELYVNAEKFLEQEKFDDADRVLQEIKIIDPSFKNVNELSKFALIEPKYRMALMAYDQGNFRKAFYLFKEITDKTGGYKESAVYQELCLEKAQFIIGMLPIENKTGLNGIENGIYGSIIQELKNLNDPLLRITDRTNTDVLFNEQFYTMSGAVDSKTAIQTGNLLGAKAILVGKIISADQEDGTLKKFSRTGWLGKETIVIDPVTKARTTVLTYSKVYYYEYEQENKASISFQYQLISTSTGEVLLSDVINISKNDRIEYATFSGDPRLLFPGVWTSQTRDMQNDRRFDTPAQKRALDNKLRARKTIKSMNDLMSDIYTETGKRVANKFSGYNPESE